jgi:hypothetical protein
MKLKSVISSEGGLSGIISGGGGGGGGGGKGNLYKTPTGNPVKIVKV